MKLVFTPFSIVLGLVAGIVGRKIFEQVWGLIDEDEPPHPQHRETGGFVKLLAALVVEGAIFRLVRGLADHGSRHGVAKLTGTWPGGERPEPEWPRRPQHHPPHPKEPPWRSRRTRSFSCCVSAALTTRSSRPSRSCRTRSIP